VADLTGAKWRKSSRSNQAGNCVEVALNLVEVVGVRDSKDPDGPALAFDTPAWAAFAASLKAGELDRP
jgi:uncharacterized protein DUF397